MEKQELISYIQVINTAGIGPINFKKLMDRFGNIDKVLSEVSLKKKIFPRQKAEEELMTAEIKGVKLLTPEDDLYPYNLKQIEDCPPLIYALGNTDLLKNDNMVAVVGSRHASISAKRLAKQIAGDLASKNIVVISGMARGIDTAAHEGALSENGNTIAVLGTGIDVIYPKENEDLYKKLIKNGLILSEYPFRTGPQTTNFPRRNRIISGMSKGVLVVEAGDKSGSMITAHQALEQGRDVYAVPGNPYDGRSSGCNKLIKDGAVLVETAEDITDSFIFTQVKFTPRKIKEDEIPNLFEYPLDKNENNSDIAQSYDKYSVLLSLISEGGEDIDEVIRESGLPSEEVLGMIVELELENKITRLPGNKIARA